MVNFLADLVQFFIKVVELSLFVLNLKTNFLTFFILFLLENDKGFLKGSILFFQDVDQSLILKLFFSQAVYHFQLRRVFFFKLLESCVVSGKITKHKKNHIEMFILNNSYTFAAICYCLSSFFICLSRFSSWAKFYFSSSVS